MSVERNVLPVLFLTVGMITTGCQPDKTENEQPVATDLANPAAVFCAESGGTYRIHRSADGSESGICTLSDGTEVDAWDYFRRESKE